MTEWQALGAGFAFYLILEGLLPFFAPQAFKRFLAQMMTMPEHHIRRFGAIMMIVGLALLFSVK